MSRDNNNMSTKAPTFKSRLIVYILISLITILPSDDWVNCNTKSFNKKKKKTRLCSRLRILFLAIAGIQKNIERSAQIISQGTSIICFIFSDE